MPKRPLEFGATLTADCKLWIVSGKGDYAIKVKLSWEWELLQARKSFLKTAGPKE
jgi:hypothetical protein